MEDILTYLDQMKAKSSGLFTPRWGLSADELRALESRIRADEREKAAKVCDELMALAHDMKEYVRSDVRPTLDMLDAWADGLMEDAAAIRGSAQ